MSGENEWGKLWYSASKHSVIKMDRDEIIEIWWGKNLSCQISVDLYHLQLILQLDKNSQFLKQITTSVKNSIGWFADEYYQS